MIPVFPHFKQLTLGDKEEIENITKLYPVYSDFNFISMWSYNIQESVKISLLNKNLVVKFLDYTSEDHFYSFLGTCRVSDTINLLLKQAEHHGLERKLKLIPQINLDNNQHLHQLFLVEEDKNNFDYIISLSHMANLNGRKLANKRNMVNRFNKMYPQCYIQEVQKMTPNIKKQIITVFHKWAQKKKNTAHELKALQRILKHCSRLDFITLGLYEKNQLIGFVCAEVAQDNFAVFHFVKANPFYKGIFEKLYNELAKVLITKSCTYINIEQDLGIPGLRHTKEQWNPSTYLKKYIISWNE